MPNSADIIQELESLPHRARIQRMLDLGRRASSEPEVAALIAALAQGDFFARYMAIATCYTSRDAEQVLGALADASQIIRGVATRLAPLALPPERLGEAIERVHPQARATLLWKLAKHGQQTAIDAYLTGHLADDTAQFLRLLPLASDTVLTQQRDRFAREADAAAWKRMARLRPAFVLDLLEARQGKDEDVKGSLDSILPLLLTALPDRTLAVAKTAYAGQSLPYRTTYDLAKRFPREVAELALTQTYSSISLTHGIQRLSDAQIVALYQRNNLPYGVGWLAQLPLPRRLTIFLAIRPISHRRNDLSIEGLFALPAAERQSEARRLLADATQSITRRLAYAVVLPWEELLSYTQDALHASETEERRIALQSIIRAVRLQPERLDVLLALLQERRSEQDFVRQTVLDELAALPAARWQTDHLPLLTEVIRHGLNDVGLSSETLSAISGLLIRLAPYHPTWASEQFITVLRERGFAAPKRTLPPPDAVTSAWLLTAIQPILATWLDQEKEAETLHLLNYLAAGRDLDDATLTHLSAYLGQARSTDTVDAILTLLRTYRFTQFGELALDLIAADPSWVTRPPVAAYLWRQRQDLLTPFLGYTSYAGRFGTGKRPFLFPVTERATGLSRTQQETYASTLDRIIADEAQDHALRMTAIQRLALLPAISSARLQALAQSANTLIRTTALFALGHTDTLEGLPTIIEALQDARGRIAILVLRRYLSAMSVTDALTLLRAVPTGRVVVAKEIVRLIADLPGTAPFEALLALASEPLQRDVRAVLLRILWRYPERAAVWPFFMGAMESPDRTVALAAVPPYREVQQNVAQLRRGSGVAGETVHSAILNLLHSGLDHPDASVQQTVVNVCGRLALPDTEGILVPRLLELVQATPGAEGRNAANALFALCTERDAASISGLFRAQRANRRALQTLVDSLASRDDSTAAIQRLWPVVNGVQQMLAQDPVLIGKVITLALPFLPAAEVVGFFTNLARRELLHSEALSQICQQIGREMARFTNKERADIQTSLMVSDDARLRRISLAFLLMQSKQGDKWESEQIDHLREFRADPAPFIAEIAQFTFIRQLDDPADTTPSDDFEDDE